MSIRDLVADKSAEDGLAHFKKLIETGSASANLWHNHKDGSKVCLAIDAIKLSETRLLGFVKDITIRMKVIDALAKSEEGLKLAQEIAHLGNWHIDLINQKTIWSDEMYKIFGVNKNEVEPSTDLFMSFIHPDDRDVFSNFTKKSEVELKSASIILRIIRKDGTIRYLYSESRFELNQDGIPVGIYGIIHDITESKQSEINLKEKNEEIEVQNEEYIQINAELLEAKDKAEENNRLKSIFLTNLSHELRTPLNGILGFSQLITGTDEQQIMDFAKVINKGGNQLLAIIEDLFIVSSILSENISDKIEEIQLNNLLDKGRFIINDEILKIDKPGLVFSVFEGVKEDNIAVLADYDMFGEIIQKLIRNAITFTNSGKIVVGFRIENKEKIIFYVRDTGIGIPIEKQEIIFDFFRQVEESATKKFGGIGSGLAISKSFVEKMKPLIEELSPSFFEITVAMAFQYFVEDLNYIF